MNLKCKLFRVLPIIQAVFITMLVLAMVGFAASADIETQISNIESSIKRLQTQVQDNSAEMASISADVRQIDAAIAALEAEASDYATTEMLNSEIEALRTELTSTLKSYVDQKISALTKNVNSNSADIAAIKTDVQDIDAALAALQSNMSKYVTTDKIKTEMATIRTELTSALESYVDQKIAALTEKVTKNTTNINVIEKDVQELDAAIAALNANMAKYASTDKVNSEISALRSELTTALKSYADQKIAELNEKVTKNTTNINVIEKDVQELDAALAALNANMSKYATAEKVNSEIAALREELTAALESYVDQKVLELTQKVNGNSADIDAIKANVKEIETAIKALESNLSQYATSEEVTDAMTALRSDVTSSLKSYVDQQIKALLQNSSGNLDVAVIVYRLDAIDEAISLLEANMENYATNDAVKTEISALRAEINSYVDQELEKLSAQVRANEEKIKKLSENDDDTVFVLAIVGTVMSGISVVALIVISVSMILNKRKVK